MFLKFDEVLVGDGVLDYPTCIHRLSKLDRDMTCSCEHLESETEYALNFSRLHQLAADANTEFLPRALRQPRLDRRFSDGAGR
jgi:hypothetical protein